MLFSIYTEGMRDTKRLIKMHNYINTFITCKYMGIVGIYFSVSLIFTDKNAQLRTAEFSPHSVSVVVSI